MDAITDTTWRVFCRWLMWSNEQGTDGFLPDAALRHLHVDGVARARKGVADMVRAGIAERVDAGHRVLDWGSPRAQPSMWRISGSGSVATSRTCGTARRKPYLTSPVTWTVT